MRLEVLTPRGPVIDSEVDEVTAPGILGEFVVLPGHIAFLTGLKPGVLRFAGKDGKGIVAVGPGFAEVSADRVAVLVDSAAVPSELAERLMRDLGIKVEAIDPAASKAQLDDTTRQLESWTSEDAGARAHVESQRDWAQARVDAASAGSGAAH